MAATKIGIIGGSGLYALDGLTAVTTCVIDTPFGAPSGVVTCGRIDDAELFFIPRHGPHHSLSPSEINYRANIYALKSLGAEWCVSVSAVGSLREEFSPGTVVVPDQLIDRTVHRAGTFFGEGLVAHVAFGEPYCQTLRGAIARVGDMIGRRDGFAVINGGTYVCMEGPAFSTRAESHLYRSWGASIVGMTALPEAKLAREAELAYATIALVTDYDCWKADGHDVDVAQVVTTMRTNVARAREILSALVAELSNLRPSVAATHALDAAIMTPLELVPAGVTTRLRPLLARRLGAPIPQAGRRN